MLRFMRSLGSYRQKRTFADSHTSVKVRKSPQKSVIVHRQVTLSDVADVFPFFSGVSGVFGDKAVVKVEHHILLCLQLLDF